jgi:hypothetical protein
MSRDTNQQLQEAFYNDGLTLEEAQRVTGLPRRVVGKWALKQQQKNRLLRCLTERDPITGKETLYFTTNPRLCMEWKLKALSLAEMQRMKEKRPSLYAVGTN